MTEKKILKEDVTNYQDYRMKKDNERFSKKVAKLAIDYIAYTQDFAKPTSSTNLKRMKKIEDKELKSLLASGKTDKSLKFVEQQTLGIHNATQNCNDAYNRRWERTLRYKELNMALQILSETQNETEVIATMDSVFSLISGKSNQSLDYEYLKRCVQKASTILEANGQEITKQKADVEDEWA